MTKLEMGLLKKEFGNDLKIEKAYHLHDEYGYNYSNQITISYKNIIVGSELVDYEFVRNNILIELKEVK